MAREKAIRNVDLVPLIIRLGLAIIFIYHGYAKVFEGGHANIAAMMTAKGAPLPQVLGWMAGITEFFGGICMALGLLSRIWGLGLIILMLVAIATVHGPHGFNLMSPKGIGYEYNVALIAMALSVLIGGPGRLALDALILKLIKREHMHKIA